jgi:ribosomal protein S12 methylthiotransferase accessory factor
VEGAPIDWVLGRWLDTGSPVYVPALPSFFAYPVAAEEAFCQVTSNGLAAGATRAEASLRAALELVERDAFTLSWLARLPGRRIHLDDSVDPGTREVARQLAAHGARLELYLVGAGVAVPAVVAIGFGDGKRWPGATVAMAAHLSPHRAIRKAVLEQGHVGPYLRRLMIEGAEPVPERPEDVRTLADHARYYFPPSRASAFAFLDGGGAIAAADMEEPQGPSLAMLVERVRAAGLRVAVVDVTSADLASTPFRVVRALGPGFQQIHFGHALACLGNPRLLARAARGINPDPHPMA